MQNISNINREILHKVGIELLHEHDSTELASRFYAKYWPDGTLRWLFKVDGFSPGFLAFYPASNFRAKLGALFMRIIGSAGLMQFLTPKFQAFKINDTGLLAESLLTNECDSWALFAGTPGVDRKVVIALSRNGQIKYYVKVPLSEISKQLIKNEAVFAREFANLQLKNVIVSPIHIIGDSIITQNLKVGHSRVVCSLNDVHIAGLKEIFVKTKFSSPLVQYVEQQNLTNILKTTASRQPMDHRLIDVGVYDVITRALHYLDGLVTNFGEYTLEQSYAHRDFTPWNTFISKNKLIIFDLELATTQVSFGFDIIHYHLQVLIMNNECLSRKEITREIQLIFQNLHRVLPKATHQELQIYLGLYILKQMADYIPKYFDQRLLHKQVFWQIKFWDEFVSSEFL
jgi:hypothetical protein